tara:strand:- start:96 stop:458 length:363 start_codon:yes stop_codon:yes gene_type:complete
MRAPKRKIQKQRKLYGESATQRNRAAFGAFGTRLYWQRYCSCTGGAFGCCWKEKAAPKEEEAGRSIPGGGKKQEEAAPEEQEAAPEDEVTKEATEPEETGEGIVRNDMNNDDKCHVETNA